MQYDLDKRSARLAIGELAAFLVGPREGGDGSQGIWRAQLGSRWHRELAARVAATDPSAEFERTIQGSLQHRGWTFTLTGRIDQVFRRGETRVLREIKTVLRPLPCDEAELRLDHPDYFAQAACYAALAALETRGDGSPPASELLFIEASTGTLQPVHLGPADHGLLMAQLDRVADFLGERLRSRERLAHLRIRPPFETLRPGQEEAIQQLREGLLQGRSAILFEAPTGFGKTGVLLDAALGALSTGAFERLIYLTSKATGQLQVVRTLRDMTASAEESIPAGSPGLTEPPSAWVLRPRKEHCVNSVFQCLPEACPYLRGLPQRWERSPAPAMIRNPGCDRSLPALRDAGLRSTICPYEITRAALPFAEIWIGDFNYVFAPSVRDFLVNQPGFEPGRSLLVIDEAHNLPTRAADAYSHVFTLDDALSVLSQLHRLHASSRLVLAWDNWCHFLRGLGRQAQLSHGDEDEALELLGQMAHSLQEYPVDPVAMEAACMDLLWQPSSFVQQLAAEPDLRRHWWLPRDHCLHATCIDASGAVGRRLRDFGGVVMASATFGPKDSFVDSIGLGEDGTGPSEIPSLLREDTMASNLPLDARGRLGSLNKRDTRKLLGKISLGSALLKADQTAQDNAALLIRAEAAWRDKAYRVAVDLRVDTRFQQRDLHLTDTARTIADWHALAGAREPGMAVFFPSYAYAESVMKGLASIPGAPLVSLQPRQSELAAQEAWIESALSAAGVLFLVLGSSFAESIDVLGGRVSRAMVVGPALPEVNPLQHARMDHYRAMGRDAAFLRVYQQPGMQKVNQALGRLVRSPGQHASVLLHCRRFADESYAQLLQPEYRGGTLIDSHSSFAAWAGSTV